MENKRGIAGAVVLAALLTAATLGMSGCTGKAEETKEVSAEVSAAEGEDNTSAEEAPEGEATGQGVVFGLGLLEEVPPELEAVVQANREALQAYQKEIAAEAGIAPSASRTVLGHTIYTERTRLNHAYVFSGTELVEVAVSVDLKDPACPLYHAEQIYEALGKAPGTLKTEDGALIQDEAAVWSEAAESKAQIEKILINGEEIDTLAVGETWGTGEALRLRAFTGVDTVEAAKQLSAPVDAVFSVGGVQYAPVGGLGMRDLTVGFDGEASFVILARKMMVPTGEGFVPDMNAYTALLSETYGADLAASGKDGGFTAMQAAVGEPVVIWNPLTGEAESVTAIYTGDDGCLYMNVEALEAITGVQVLLSQDGTQANIITDAQYNRLSGGAGSGLTQTALDAREDVQQAANDYQVLVAMARSAEEELRIQNEQYQKQLEEAARQQAQMNESSSTGESSSSSGGSGDTSGGSGSTSSEPSGPAGETGGSVSKPEESTTSESSTGGGTAGRATEEPTSGAGYETAQRNNAVWDPELGGWVYIGEHSGTTILIYPGGDAEYIR